MITYASSLYKTEQKYHELVGMPDSKKDSVFQIQNMIGEMFNGGAGEPF